MSALQAPLGSPRNEPGTPTPLRAVPTKPRQLSQLPFVLIVALLLGGGMVGVLILSTTIQTQSVTLSALQSQEAELRYQEAALVAQVQDLRSSQKLAEQAWALGMRPNPHPAFIQMPEGTVIGVPVPVTGDELPGMVPPVVAVPEPAPVPAAPEPEPAAAPPAAEAPAEAAAEQAPAQEPPAEAPQP